MRIKRVSPYHSYAEMRERMAERDRKLAKEREIEERKKKPWM